MSLIFLDIETTGLSPFFDKIVTVQFLTETGQAYIIKGKELDNLKAYRSAFENNTIVGHNLKFDTKFLKQQYGINITHVYDTMLAELAIMGGPASLEALKTREGRERGGVALADLVLRYFGATMDKSHQCSFRLGEELTPEQIEYCFNDLRYLPKLMSAQQEKIKEMKLESVVQTEMNMIPVTVWLELSGIYYDSLKLQEITKKLQLQEKDLKYELYQMLGTSKISLNSSQAMVKALNARKVPVTSCNKEELSKFEHPIISKLLEYKTTNHLITSFANKLPDYKNKRTGRVHADFFQYGTKSGRFSCKNPNLQQQPSRFKEWRTIFVATPGNKIVACDYSQIELRILGEIAGEEEFMRAYNNKEDLHKLTASKIFGKPLDQVEKKERSIAKTVNFGLNYGMSSNGLIKKLKTDAGIDMSEEEAVTTITAFKKAYPKITQYMDRVSQHGAECREMRNAAGRYLKIDPESDYGAAGREAMNLPIQSLCADMLKEAMPRICAELDPLGVKFVNTIHDEVVFEVPEEHVEFAEKLIKEEMEKYGRKYMKKIDCVAEVTISDYWKKD